MGEASMDPLRVGFAGSFKLEFHGSKVVTHARYVIFQLAEVAVPRWLLQAVLERIRRLRPRQAVPG